MEILNKILSSFKQKFFLGNTFITGIEVPNVTQKDYLESFRASSLVHSCTKKIGEKMSTIDFELYQLRGLIAREIEQHEVLDLLANPNPAMTGSQLQEITSIYLSLLGNCYWYKARNFGGKIIELWLMRPDMTTIIPANDGSVGQYKFINGGKEMKFPFEDVIHFKEPDPLSDYYGYGAIQSVMETIRADVYAKKWNTRFFFNSARPDAVLTTEKAVGKADREEIREKWVEKYGGWQNAQRVAILSHGLDYKQISVNQKDMDFANMRIANRDDILMTLGVPKSVIGVTDDVNRASADAGIYAFLSETIRPKMEKMADVLNQQLLVSFGDDLIIVSLDPTPDDKTSLDAHYTNAHNKWMTTNEIRIEEGFEPIEGGDYIYQPLNLMPLGSDYSGEDSNSTGGNVPQKAIFTKIGGNYTAKDYYKQKKERKLQDIYRKAMRGRKQLRMQEDLVKQIVIEATTGLCKLLKKKEKTVKYSDEDKNVLWAKFDKSLIGWEKKFLSVLKKLLSEQKERAIKKLDSLNLGKEVKSKEVSLLNKEKEIKIFAKKTKPVFSEIVEEAGNEALREVGEKSMKKDFEIADPVTAEWIDKKVMTFAEQVNETTIKRIKLALAEGVLNGESIDQLKKRILEIFEKRTGDQSRVIARTEVLSSNNAGTVFGYKQSGVVEKKEWLATRDKRCREEHLSADGQIVKLEENFSVGGEKLEYPGDPNGSAENIINCRCTIIPIVK